MIPSLPVYVCVHLFTDSFIFKCDDFNTALLSAQSFVFGTNYYLYYGVCVYDNFPSNQIKVKSNA